MNWMLENLCETLLIAGLILLVIEVLLLGFATFFLFFVGVAAIITSGLMAFGWVAEDLTQALLWVGALSALLGLVLYQPLRKLQGQVESKDVSNDFNDFSFTLEHDIGPDRDGTVKYSGVTWTVKSQQPIAKDTQVQVIKSDVGVVWVQPS